MSVREQQRRFEKIIPEYIGTYTNERIYTRERGGIIIRRAYWAKETMIARE